MDNDLLMVAGFVLVFGALTPLLGAIADRRLPRTSLIVFLTGGVLFGVAFAGHAYDIAEIPMAFLRVVARVLH